MKPESGLTFLEILIMVVVLAVVAAITFPKFRTMLYQSREGRTKTSLGELRGALAIYYSDNHGLYPSDDGTPETRLSSSLVPQYLKSVPFVELKHHHPDQLNTIQDRLNDTGDWFYSMLDGFVAVNCRHEDTKNNVISNW